MFHFVTSLFGCAHRRCTFPITATRTGTVLSKAQSKAGSGGQSSRSTYIVCLDCGKEFHYDWQQMKVGAAANSAA